MQRFTFHSYIPGAEIYVFENSRLIEINLFFFESFDQGLIVPQS